MKIIYLFTVAIFLILSSCSSKQTELDSGEITLNNAYNASMRSARTQGSDLTKEVFRKNFVVLLNSKKISINEDTALARFYFSSMEEIDEKIKTLNQNEK